MKKNLLILMLILAFFASGCVNENTQAPQTSPATETESVTDNKSSAAEPADQKNSTAEPDKVSDYDISKLDDYLASVEEESNALKYSIRNDMLNQNELNMKALELYELWDDALNYLWGELKLHLPEAAFEELLSEQLIWIEEKEAAQKEAGSEVEGGSLYPLVVNGRGAAITEERVYEFYEILKQSV